MSRNDGPPYKAVPVRTIGALRPRSCLCAAESLVNAADADASLLQQACRYVDHYYFVHYVCICTLCMYIICEEFVCSENPIPQLRAPVAKTCDTCQQTRQQTRQRQWNGISNIDDKVTLEFLSFTTFMMLRFGGMARRLR